MQPILSSWLASSQDPTQVSNTVRGAILSVSAIIVFLGAHFLGLTLTATDVASLATEIGAVAGAVWFFYGLLMKGTIKAGSIRQ